MSNATQSGASSEFQSGGQDITRETLKKVFSSLRLSVPPT